MCGSHVSYVRVTCRSHPVICHFLIFFSWWTCTYTQEEWICHSLPSSAGILFYWSELTHRYSTWLVISCQLVGTYLQSTFRPRDQSSGRTWHLHLKSYWVLNAWTILCNTKTWSWSVSLLRRDWTVLMVKTLMVDLLGAADLARDNTTELTNRIFWCGWSGTISIN